MYRGGGLYIEFGSPSLNNVSFTNNSADPSHTGAGWGGGGVFIDRLAGTVTITNSTFSSNDGAHGGGIYQYGGSAVLTNVQFLNNQSFGSGGGIYESTNTPNLTITNGFFTGNTAGPGGASSQVFGGGLYIDSGTATVINSLFTGNTVPASHEGYGGGIARRGGSISVRNSIVWGNSAKTSSPQIYWPESVTYSDVEGGVAGTGNINLDPQITGNYHISAGLSLH